MHFISQRGDPIQDLPESHAETTTLLPIENATGKKVSY